MIPVTAAMIVEEFAPAKINLTLAVTGRRDDGYHLIDSIFVFTQAGDRLWARDADGLSLELTGPQADALLSDGADNLVLKAARALQAETGTAKGAAMKLEKHLPLASGIGGGSADAAAALRALNRLWGLGLGLGDLARIGARVGADVPASVYSVPMRVTGIGEKLEPLGPLTKLGVTAFGPSFGILLVNPGVAVPTPAVFAALRAAGTPFAEAAGDLPGDFSGDFLEALRGRPNMLEAPAIALQPIIADVLDRLRELPGVLLARMSGSGATCFALFPSPEAAEQAAALVAGCDKWWIWSGGLIDTPASL